MIKQKNVVKNGFTLIELLIVSAIIAILLAIAIPNMLRSRISANEANARKFLQTLRDAEYQYYEQDLDEDEIRDFTASINDDGNSLRFPISGGSVLDSLIDDSYAGLVVNDGGQATSSTCTDPKAGYCLSWTTDFSTDQQVLLGDFGWEASPTSVRKTGRHDFSVYADKQIRCTITTQTTGTPGSFESSRNDPDCDL